MSDDVQCDITEMRFTRGDKKVYLRRTQMGDGTDTYDVWCLDDPSYLSSATFPADQTEAASAAAVQLLEAKEQAGVLRAQADQMERDAVASIAQSAQPIVAEPPVEVTP